MRQTQQQRILAVLEAVRDNTHTVPDEYIRHHSTGNGVSARYFKQVMLISEVNGRLSELRAKLRLRGMTIESSSEKDRHGFAYQRLVFVGAARTLAIPV
jgi:hypothetical protein